MLRIFLATVVLLLLGDMVNAQINESELGKYFGDRQFKRFDATYKRDLALHYKNAIAGTRKGSDEYKSLLVMQKLLREKDTLFTAPPFHDVTAGDIGDLGRPFREGKQIKYGKLFQKLTGDRFLMRLSFDGRDYFDEIYLVKDLTKVGALTAFGNKVNNVDETSPLPIRFAPEVMFIRAENYSYKNALGATRVVRVFRVLSSNEWRYMIRRAIEGFVGTYTIDDQAGAKVTNLYPGSPAATAGIKVGDIITRFDGKKVNGDAGLSKSKKIKKPGDKVELDGKYVPHFKPGKELRDRVNASIAA